MTAATRTRAGGATSGKRLLVHVVAILLVRNVDGRTFRTRLRWREDGYYVEMTENAGPQEEQGASQSEGSPEEGQHLTSPEPGYPVEQTEPHGGAPAHAHEHPEDIGSTPSDEQGEEEVTQQPSAPPDPESGAD